MLEPKCPCPIEVNDSAEPIEISWYAIPKGITIEGMGSEAVRLLTVTVMAVFRQNTFSDLGPFDKDNNVHNWPEWVKEHLECFDVSVTPVSDGAVSQNIPFSQDILKENLDLKNLSADLWRTFFSGVTRPEPGLHKQQSAKAAPITLRDPTTVFARGAQEIVAHLVTQQWTQLTAQAGSLSEQIAAVSTTIDSLFPRRDNSHLTACPSWQETLRIQYAELANIFLPPRPTISDLVVSDDIEDYRSKLPLNEQTLFDSINEAYNPIKAGSSGRKSDDGSHKSVFSANACRYLLNSLTELNAASNKGASMFFTRNNTQEYGQYQWTKLAVAQLVTGLPYQLPDLKTQDLAALCYQSAQNRLAMLMAEPGVLSNIGMLFDFEMEVPELAQHSLISVTPKWKGCPSFYDVPVACHMGAEGTPLPRTAVFTDEDTWTQTMRSVFDPRGYLKLGSTDSDKQPLFMLTDFRIDEAVMMLQNNAQEDRNRMPEYSPGANQFILPPIEMGEIRSHDVVLHWNMRPDFALAQRSLAASSVCLDDLVVGLRPHIGRVCGNRIDWFDLTSRTVTYSKVTWARSAADLARDAGFSHMVHSDKRDSSTSSISEALCQWSGWAIGTQYPDTFAKTALGKEEIVTPGSLPPFRFGDEIYMGARLVLRDGSSLQTPQQAATAFGKNLADRDSLLSVGRHTHGQQEPFRLLRWERLRAPQVLLAEAIGALEWWPTERATRMVVATSMQEGLRHHPHSRRFIVPGREDDMYTTWKSGMFDKVEPHISAFSDVEMDDNGQFRLLASGGNGGHEAAFRRTSFFGSKCRSVPYHPDPLATRVRIYAARRQFPGSRHWAPVFHENGEPIFAEFQFYPARQWPDAKEVQIDLHAVERWDHALFVADHKHSVLDVYLPRGESMVLVVTPLGDPDVLSRKHAFGADRVQAMLEKVENSLLLNIEGRMHLLNNGMMQFLANQVMIDIEHVLDRPAWQPILEMYSPVRNESDTSVLFDAIVQFDPSSTGTIEVHSTWVEQEGNLARLIASHTENQTAATSQSFSSEVQRYDHHELGSCILDGILKSNTVIRPMKRKTLKCQHELHDQKHREVLYWVRGISSVSGQATDEAHFVLNKSFAWPSLASGQTDALEKLKHGNLGKNSLYHHIPASRKPKPPTLSAVLPAFEFQVERTPTTIRRTRTSVLAVHMDCDWFDSGNGEKLALVLLKPGASEAPFAEVRYRYEKIATFWGADPTRQGEDSMARLPDYLTEYHLEGSPTVIDYPNDKVAGLRLALYAPLFCAEEGTWRVEVAVRNPAAVSRPFVRLAFCRYQEYALPFCQMSEIVVADYAQLSDDREAVIMRTPGNAELLKVEVYGISFEGSQRSVQPRMFAWLERRCASLKNAEEAAWVKEGRSVEFSRDMREGRACWHGELNAGEAVGYDRFRVAIVEEEFYRQSGPAGSYGAIPVYFDLVSLSD